MAFRVLILAVLVAGAASADIDSDGWPWNLFSKKKAVKKEPAVKKAPAVDKHEVVKQPYASNLRVVAEEVKPVAPAAPVTAAPVAAAPAAVKPEELKPVVEEKRVVSEKTQAIMDADAKARAGVAFQRQATMKAEAKAEVKAEERAAKQATMRALYDLHHPGARKQKLAKAKKVHLHEVARRQEEAAYEARKKAQEDAEVKAILGMSEKTDPGDFEPSIEITFEFMARTTHVKVPHEHHLKPAMMVAGSRLGFNWAALRFFFHGQPVDREDTPASLGMLDGDVVLVG